MTEFRECQFQWKDFYAPFNCSISLKTRTSPNTTKKMGIWHVLAWEWRISRKSYCGSHCCSNRLRSQSPAFTPEFEKSQSIFCFSTKTLCCLSLMNDYGKDVDLRCLNDLLIQMSDALILLCQCYRTLWSSNEMTVTIIWDLVKNNVITWRMITITWWIA